MHLLLLRVSEHIQSIQRKAGEPAIFIGALYKVLWPVLLLKCPGLAGCCSGLSLLLYNIAAYIQLCVDDHIIQSIF